MTMSEKKMIPAALSNRHLHLAQEHIDLLFGENYNLCTLKDLSQPGQFACEEKVDLIGPKGEIKGIRVLGPARPQTQIEVSVSDSFLLGVKPPIRDSGDIDDSPGVTLRGPKGEVQLDKGVIIAARHIHMHSSDAEKYNVKDKDRVKVRTSGERALIFENVLVRVSPKYALEMHLDTDEGNAANLRNGSLVELITE
jgi:putative phosphotransacetylase